LLQSDPIHGNFDGDHLGTLVKNKPEFAGTLLLDNPEFFVLLGVVKVIVELTQEFDADNSGVGALVCKDFSRPRVYWT